MKRGTCMAEIQLIDHAGLRFLAAVKTACATLLV